MRAFFIVAGGLVGIAALLAVVAAVLHSVCWMVVAAIGRVPLVGRKHRHAGWGLRRRP